MSGRRQVRVTEHFFDRLDDLLPESRTATGGPSAADFLLHEMPAIIDRLAASFEASTLAVDDDPDLRVLITADVMVTYIAVYAVLTSDGAIEIIYLELDSTELP